MLKQDKGLHMRHALFNPNTLHYSEYFGGGQEKKTTYVTKIDSPYRNTPNGTQSTGLNGILGMTIDGFKQLQAKEARKNVVNTLIIDADVEARWADLLVPYIGQAPPILPEGR